MSSASISAGWNVVRVAFVAFALGFSGSFVSCQQTCTPANCRSGCCTEDGLCSTGDLRLECGQNAEACMACSQSEKCVEHRCYAPPVVDAGVDAGPVTCQCATACCLEDGSCAPSNDPTACGIAHAFCGQCTTGQRCEFGTCVNSTCANGCLDPLGVCRPGTALSACGRDGGVCVACGSDQACSGQRCVFTRCDMTNCRFGCCRPDKSCETTINESACGAAGSACTTCPVATQCIGGQCL